MHKSSLDGVSQELSFIQEFPPHNALHLRESISFIELVPADLALLMQQVELCAAIGVMQGNS